jgi:hypothetical protein
LIKEGKKVQEKIAIARQQKEEQELKNLNFKPHIYKPPKSVVPRYRGLPVYEVDGNASTKAASTEKSVSVGVVTTQKTLRGGLKKKTVVDKKTTPAKATPTKTTPRQAQLTTSEKLLKQLTTSAVWLSLSGQDNSNNEGNENKQNVPPPPNVSQNPPLPPPNNKLELINDHVLDDKITNRKAVKGKKKVED